MLRCRDSGVEAHASISRDNTSFIAKRCLSLLCPGGWIPVTGALWGLKFDRYRQSWRTARCGFPTRKSSVLEKRPFRAHRVHESFSLTTTATNAMCLVLLPNLPLGISTLHELAAIWVRQ